MSTNDQYGGYSGTPASSSQPDGGYQYGQYSAPSSADDQQYQQQQMYQAPASAQAYQPPTSALKRQEPALIGKGDRQAAALSYVLGPITGLLYFFVLGRKNRFVRYSAAQSTVVFGAFTVLYILAQLVVHIPLLGGLLAFLFGFVGGFVGFLVLLLWAALIFTAWRGMKFRVPIAADYAEKMMERFSK
jgi:uncharacterized membrane protein